MVLSQRDPGCLLRSALRDMKRYLAARGEANKEDLTAGRVVSYLHQILLPQYAKAGLRSQRELVTLATGLDTPRGRSRSARPLSRRKLVGGKASRIDCDSGLSEHPSRVERSREGGAESPGVEAAASRGWKDRLGNWRRRRQEGRFRDADKQEEETLAEKASRQSASEEGHVREVPREGRWSSPSRSSRKGPRWPGEGEGLGAESPISGSWATSSQRGSDVSGEESEPEGEVQGADERYLEAFSDFCAGLDLGGKSMAQMAVILVQVVHRSGGNFGVYAEKAAKMGSSQQGTGEVWRDLLPLPVPRDVADLVIGIWKDDGYTVKKSGKTGAQVQHEYRDVGIDCLQFCMIVGLNMLWSGLRGGARIHGGPLKAAQREALSHLRRAASYVIDGKEAAPQKGVPRTPKESWSRLVQEARISYHGEVIQKAEALEFDRVLPSLPPEGFGGIADLGEGQVKELLLDPQRCQIPESELPDVIPSPKVRVKDGDWDKLARALFERGIVAPVDQVIGLRGKSVLNGLFGVQKAGRVRATNAILKIIAGDISTLAGASAFTSIVIVKGQVVTISGDDLVSSFYLFKMPPAWLPYLAFERSVSWKALGIEKELWRCSGNCPTVQIIIKNILICIIFPFFKIDFHWKTSHSLWVHDADIVLISNTALKIS